MRQPPRTVRPSNRRTLASVMIAMAVTTFTATALTVALPRIQADLGMTFALAQWVLLAYLLLITALLIPLGRLGDDRGHGRVFLGGWGVLALGSALCGLAPTGGTLIGARGVQTIGAAAIFALSPALLADVFSARRLGRALGGYGIAVGVGSALGPLLGGALVQTLGWRGLFWATAVMAGAGAWTALPLARITPSASAPPRDADWAGAGLLFLLLASVQGALSAAGRWGIASLPVAVASVVCVATVAVFIAWERRSRAPLVDLRLFRQRRFAAGAIAACVCFLIWYAVLFLVPYVLQRAAGLAPAAAGGILASFTALYAATAPVSGWATDRVASRLPAMTGMGMTVVALGWLATVTLPVTPGILVAQMAVFGVGVGLFVTANNTAMLQVADEGNRGMVAGVMGTARNFGMALGVSLGGSLFGVWLTERGGSAGAMLGGFDRVMALMAALGLAGLTAVAVGEWRPVRRPAYLRTADGLQVLAWMVWTADDLKAQIMRILEPRHLTLAQVGAMRHLRAGPLTLSDLAIRLGTRPDLAARVTASLARRGLVAQADRLSLTAEGERLCAEILDTYSALLGRFLEALTPEEMGLLKAAVGKLHRLQEPAG